VAHGEQFSNQFSEALVIWHSVSEHRLGHGVLMEFGNLKLIGTKLLVKIEYRNKLNTSINVTCYNIFSFKMPS
jgi:hypothetical protein